MEARSTAALALMALLSAACAEGGGSGGDAGRMDAARLDGGRDASRGDAGSRDAGMRDAGNDAGTDASVAIDAGPRPDAGACAVAPGSLAIVEVMVSSRSGIGDLGEWFEVVGTTDCTLDLTGVEIVSPDAAGAERAHTISALISMPGQRLVLAQSGVDAENHFLPHDYVYGAGIVLENAHDWIELRAGGAVIDRVEWPSGGFTHGRARQLPPSAALRDNGTWSRWCDASVSYSDTGGTFYGTPQADNVACM